MKICLLVQNKVLKSKKTEVVKKTDNPNFSESFTFKLPVSNLDSASINITAMQHQSGYKGRYHIYSVLCGRVVSEVELVFHKPLKKEVVSLNPVRGRVTRLQSSTIVSFTIERSVVLYGFLHQQKLTSIKKKNGAESRTKHQSINHLRIMLSLIYYL